MTSQLRATCSCTSTILLRAGALVCASCNAPIVGPGEVTRTFTTNSLPPDAKDAAAFNRACRSGRVRGAFKIGRIWSCDADAWRDRARAPRPRGLAPKISKRAKALKVEPSTRDALLEELGLTTKRTG